MDDFESVLNELVGERTDEETLTKAKKLKDCFDDVNCKYQQSVSREGGTLPEKFKTWCEALNYVNEELNEVRHNYIERFLTGKDPEKPIEEDDDEKELTYDNLFKKG